MLPGLYSYLESAHGSRTGRLPGRSGLSTLSASGAVREGEGGATALALPVVHGVRRTTRGEPVGADRTLAALPGLVLIHGAFHTARCWAPTVGELARQVPDLKVLAVDLPGRGASPAELREVTLRSCVDSVVEQIDRAGLGEVVVAAHSLGGLTAPVVVERLGPDRVARLVLIAAAVPPQGATDLDLVAGRPLRWLMKRMLPPGRIRQPPPRLLARACFCNGMTRAQRTLVYDQLCAEATNLYHEPVDRSGLPGTVPRTWILPRRDRALPPRTQRSCMANLGRVDEVVEVDTCHDVMLSAPAMLATILAERCASGTVMAPSSAYPRPPARAPSASPTCTAPSRSSTGARTESASR